MDRTRPRVRARAVLTTLALLMVLLPFGPRPAAADHGEPHVVLESGVNGCMGVRTTPGSENTDKVLTGGTLEPGSIVEFTISYPVDPEDVAGRTTFVITDCVFIDDEPIQKYSVSFVPNTTDFVLVFELTIPEDAPIGAEYCNFAKTTAAPSASQASNRKAGPACFRIGGDLRILKEDPAGNPLTGATFDVTCVPPGPTPPVLIEGVDTDSATGIGTGADNAISITGPEGTVCTITEVSAPPGYQLPPLADRTVVATIGVDGPNIVFVNTLAPGSLDVVKVAPASSTQVFNFTVNCTNPTNTYLLSITGSGTTTQTGIPAGSVCTVVETVPSGFNTPLYSPAGGVVTIGAGTTVTVTVTNTLQPGSLSIVKVAPPTTQVFSFTVTCNPGNLVYSLQVTGSGTVTQTGIPAGSICVVVENGPPTGWEPPVYDPANGTVTVTAGATVTVTVTNSPTPQEPPPTGGEGCTPGFWKNHPEAWAGTGFTTGQTLGSVFTGLPNNLANASLLEALGFEGGNNMNGARRILLRAAVAALLNSASGDVDYPRTTAEVIADVNAALASGSRSTILDLASELDADNNLGCPQ